MLQNRDLRKIFDLKPQDLQYLLVGRFVEPTETISKGPRGRRLFDLRATFSVGVLSALRQYRVDFRVGYILLQVLEEVLDDFQVEVAKHISIPMYNMILGFSPFHHIDTPLTDYYLDFKDQKWVGLHLKKPEDSIASCFDVAYGLVLVEEGECKDEYRFEKKVLFPHSGEAFWKTYDSLVSINLVTITKKIKAYLEAHPGIQID